MYFFFEKSSSLGTPIIIASYCEVLNEDGKGYWTRRETFVDYKKVIEEAIGEPLQLHECDDPNCFRSHQPYPTYYGDTMIIGDKSYPYGERFQVVGDEVVLILTHINGSKWKEFDWESWGK